MRKLFAYLAQFLLGLLTQIKFAQLSLFSMLYDILVIGELNVDLILTGEDLQPDFGQAEKLVEDATLALGSSSAIFACGASRLGLRVAFAGKVGQDDFGRYILNTLQRRGVDTSPVVVDPEIKTGVTLHLSRPDDRAMLTFLGSIAAFRFRDVDPSLFSQTRHVHQGSFFLQTGLQPDLAHLFASAHQAGATVSLDPGWDPREGWNGFLPGALKTVDVFLPNAQEAQEISGEATPEAAGSRLSSNIPLVVIKLGEQGAVAFSGEQHEQCAGFSVESINTTGAGDSFDAGFLYGFLQEFPLEESLRWGCACGALSTTHVGGIEGQPTVAEVQAFLASR